MSVQFGRLLYLDLPDKFLCPCIRTPRCLQMGVHGHSQYDIYCLQCDPRSRRCYYFIHHRMEACGNVLYQHINQDSHYLHLHSAGAHSLHGVCSHATEKINQHNEGKLSQKWAVKYSHCHRQESIIKFDELSSHIILIKNFSKDHLVFSSNFGAAFFAIDSKIGAKTPNLTTKNPPMINMIKK